MRCTENYRIDGFLMKYLLIVTFFLFSFLYADDQEDKQLLVQNDQTEELVEVKDTSGLTKDEVRKIADEEDKKVEVKAKDVIKTIVESDSKGNIDISKLQTPWENMSPTPKAYDWVQTKSGEWFKGEIKALYNDKLEFDSDEVGLYNFDFEDITQIKSFNTIGVNIEDTAVFTGIIRFKNDTITIIQGDKIFKFDRKEVVSMAPEGTSEYNYWSGKITLNIDMRKGNKDQYDYVAKATIKRRTSKSNLLFDYLGRISARDNEETANDHRLNQKYDRYITRRFFWTPLFSEFYKDRFQNIQNQITAGVGIGYKIADNDWAEWDVSGGPAYTYVEYVSVIAEDKVARSPALELSTKMDLEINSRTDLKYDWKVTFSDERAGTYKHHMVATLENEITSWLDLDIGFVWDYLLQPEEASSGEMPDRSDYQFLIGLGIEF